MTKAELEQQVLKYEKEINKLKLNNEDLQLKLKIAQDNVETHKRASFEQTKEVNQAKKIKDEAQLESQKLENSYNLLAQIFDEYVSISRNTLKQLEGLSQASVMLEKNVTQKIQNFNKGVESK